VASESRQAAASLRQGPSTTTALVLNAAMGEQQRPQQVTSGLLQGLLGRLPVLALAGGGLPVRARRRRKPTS
jgi:hypothetical protein